ncbi:MAG: hypothetical protein AAF570_14795, partial [Bacteroidota bacterium]
MQFAEATPYRRLLATLCQVLSSTFLCCVIWSCESSSNPASQSPSPTYSPSSTRNVASETRQIAASGESGSELRPAHIGQRWMQLPEEFTGGVDAA